jgi:hypothetical protein
MRHGERATLSGQSSYSVLDLQLDELVRSWLVDLLPRMVDQDGSRSCSTCLSMDTHGFRVGYVHVPSDSGSVDGTEHWDQCTGCHVERRRRDVPSAYFEPIGPCLSVVQDRVARVLGHGASWQPRIALSIGGIAIQVLGVVGRYGST